MAKDNRRVWSETNACRGENDRTAQIFNGGALFYSSLYALGIGAASFASAVYGASKDIAESPTACRNAQRQFIIHNA